MGGILILYAVVLGTLPAVFELRRRAGDLAVVGLSLGLYAVAWGTGGLLWARQTEARQVSGQRTADRAAA